MKTWSADIVYKRSISAQRVSSFRRLQYVTLPKEPGNRNLGGTAEIFVPCIFAGDFFLCTRALRGIMSAGADECPAHEQGRGFSPARLHSKIRKERKWF